MAQGLSVNQILSHRQTTILAPQLQQGVRILQLSVAELQKEIDTALEGNPFLEKVELDHPSDTFSSPDISPVQRADSKEGERRYTPGSTVRPSSSPIRVADNKGLTAGHRPDQFSGERPESEIDADWDLSLHGYLRQQAATTPLDARQHFLLELLIDSVNDKGYLRASVDDIVELAMPEYVVSLKQVEQAIKVLQSFEPAGVGARTSSECLMLQLRELPADTPHLEIAKQIVARHLLSLAKKEYELIAEKLNISNKSLQDGIGLIRQLNPFPGLSIAAPREEYITPDLVVKKVNGRWAVRLNPNVAPTIGIHQESADLLRLARGQKGYDKLKKRFDDARTLMSNIEKRYHTLLRVAGVIIERQAEFLDKGQGSLQPLTQKEIAEELEIHVSTVSRAVHDKYVLTAGGVLELGSFFCSSISRKGGERISSRAIQEQIRQLIAAEPADKPLSDLKITELLGERGIPVARRTVMKYRKQLGIPASPQRRKN